MPQPSEKRRHVLAGGRLDRADSDPAALALAKLLQAAPQRVDGVQDRERPLAEEGAGCRQRPAAAGPVEEREAQLLLELLHVERHGRLGEAQGARRTQEAALAKDGLEGREVAQLPGLIR